MCACVCEGHRVQIASCWRIGVCVICTSHVALPLTSPHLIPLHTSLSLSQEDTRVCVCVGSKGVFAEEEEEEEAHRDRQMLKDKDVQLRSINCKAGEGCHCSDTGTHRPRRSHTHTHTHTAAPPSVVNFIPIRVHVSPTEVFVLQPPWVSAGLCSRMRPCPRVTPLPPHA